MLQSFRKSPKVSLYQVLFFFQTLAGLPDQDTFYDVVDCLEELGIAAVSQRHLNKKGTDLDLVEQFNIYEVTIHAFCKSMHSFSKCQMMRATGI